MTYGNVCVTHHTCFLEFSSGREKEVFLTVRERVVANEYASHSFNKDVLKITCIMEGTFEVDLTLELISNTLKLI